MLRLCQIKRPGFTSAARNLKRALCIDAPPVPEVKKKKRFSELTPQELEAEIEQNLILLRKSFEKDESENYVVPIFKKSILHADRVAIKDPCDEYTYIQLYLSSKRLAFQISNVCGSASMKNVGYLCPNNVLTPLTQWACWMSGQVAMPLNTNGSPDLLKVVLKDSKAKLLIASFEHEGVAAQLSEALDLPTIIIDRSFMVPPETNLKTMPRLIIPMLGTVIVEGTFTNDFYTNANAMLLYTRGNTGKPKGVMLSHGNIDAQMRSLRDAWKYDSNDILLHALPQQYAHGFFNAYMCPLSVGGRILMHDRFDVKNIWADLLGINTPAKERINCFVAIPSVYNLLIDQYERSFTKRNMMEYVAKHCKENIRLMASGGAPLASATFRRWQKICGHQILEFYGSTEFGVVMSNPYLESAKQKECKRESGFVGLPLPDVRARLVDSKGKVLIDCIGEYIDQIWGVRYLETETQPQKISQSETKKIQFIFGIKTRLKDIFVTATRLFDIFHYFKPSIKIKNIKTDNNLEIKNEHDKPIPKDILLGELEINGPQIFKNYFNTSETCPKKLDDEFFKTGDLAIYQQNAFRILGRCNVDVIEVDGKKISTYDIESLLLEHPQVRDVSVVAIPKEGTIFEADESKKPIKVTKTFGVICALHQGAELDLNSLNIFCSKSLPKCFLPTKLKIVDELPYFTKTEINRQALVDLFQKEEIKPS